MTLFILAVIVILWIKINPKLDYTAEGKTLLWYGSKEHREYIDLTNII